MIEQVAAVIVTAMLMFSAGFLVGVVFELWVHR